MGVIPKRKRPVTVTAAALLVVVEAAFLGFLPLILSVSVDYREALMYFIFAFIFSFFLLRLHNFARWVLGIRYVAFIALLVASDIIVILTASLRIIDLINLITLIIFAAIYFYLITTRSAREVFKKKTIAN